MTVQKMTKHRKNSSEIGGDEGGPPPNEECPDMSARAIIMKKFICVMKTLPLYLSCSFELFIS